MQRAIQLFAVPLLVGLTGCSLTRDFPSSVAKLDKRLTLLNNGYQRDVQACLREYNMIGMMGQKRGERIGGRHVAVAKIRRLFSNLAVSLETMRKEVGELETRTEKEKELKNGLQESFAEAIRGLRGISQKDFFRGSAYADYLEPVFPVVDATLGRLHGELQRASVTPGAPNTAALSDEEQLAKSFLESKIGKVADIQEFKVRETIKRTKLADMYCSVKVRMRLGIDAPEIKTNWEEYSAIFEPLLGFLWPSANFQKGDVLDLRIAIFFARQEDGWTPTEFMRTAPDKDGGKP